MICQENSIHTSLPIKISGHTKLVVIIIDKKNITWFMQNKWLLNLNNIGPLREKMHSLSELLSKIYIFFCQLLLQLT